MGHKRYCVEKCEDVCTPTVSVRSGWWTGWTPVVTANQAQEIVQEWQTRHVRTNNTGKVVDAAIHLDYGNHLIYSRRNRVYLWLDFRVLVNGTAVLTNTFDRYWYRDERSDTNPDIIEPQQYEIIPMGATFYTRKNIPIGATVEVQTQSRWQVATSQTSSYARYIGGLRSRAEIDFYLQDLAVPK